MPYKSVPMTPLLQAYFNQTTYNRWQKCHDDVLAKVKKPFFFKLFLNQKHSVEVDMMADVYPRFDTL